MPEPFKSDNALSHELSSRSVVPDDFPSDPFPAALAGTQTKFAARLINCKYVVGLTPEERSQRHLECLDLVNQLSAYIQRKREQKPEVPLPDILDNVVNRIPLQGWNLGIQELEWIAKQLRQRFAST
jgi:hypothetical protein